ncbi:hypothetical protein IQ22_01028 [Pseudomonas duriflava]|uniref:Lipoprotein n=1 Tax=Pseudomonas duriflava TaxID=459528 RepID=A0A562QIJ7_9PSED|nr:hypothetical protein [Pseudomonas duriflava]TWI56577.1 hypothetical protein IQ22_01028 [Pseudomonas duriflava]
MRRFLLVCPALALSACSLMPLPKPDPSQAWVDLHPAERNVLQAAKADSHELKDPRYFQVPPGAHDLQVRFQFEVDPSNIGPGATPLQRTCLLKVHYKEFSAGERYRLQAEQAGFRAVAKLYDENQQEVARGGESRCGDV